MGYLTHVVTLGDDNMDHAWGIVRLEILWFDNKPFLYSGSFADGGITRLELGEGAHAVQVQSVWATARGGTQGLTDMEVIEIAGRPYLLAPGRYADQPAFRVLRDDGSIGGLRDITAETELASWTYVTGFSAWGNDYLVSARFGEAGLHLFEIGQDFSLTQLATIADERKATLGDISGLVTLEIGGETFIIAASAGEAGVSSFRMLPGGEVELADMLGAGLGIGWSGTSALATAEVGGEQFVLVGSTGTSTITVLRVNEMGVMFITDHVLDNLHTRFAKLVDIATFSHGERSFAVAGGVDDGLTLFEIGPGGQLYLLQSIAGHNGWQLSGVQSVAADVIGSEAQIFAAGPGQAGVTQFRVDMSRFGDVLLAGDAGGTLHGGPLDDHLEAGSGDATLWGGAGNDRLVAGSGETVMWGGAGADVFVFRPGGTRDLIMDFEQGNDRIDLTAYPMLYSTRGIEISPTDDGARLMVQGDEILLRTANFAALQAADFRDEDFIFS